MLAIQALKESESADEHQSTSTTNLSANVPDTSVMKTGKDFDSNVAGLLEHFTETKDKSKVKKKPLLRLYYHKIKKQAKDAFWLFFHIGLLVGTRFAAKRIFPKGTLELS